MWSVFVCGDLSIWDLEVHPTWPSRFGYGGHVHGRPPKRQVGARNGNPKIEDNQKDVRGTSPWYAFHLTVWASFVILVGFVSTS